MTEVCVPIIVDPSLEHPKMEERGRALVFCCDPCARRFIESVVSDAAELEADDIIVRFEHERPQ